MQDWVDHLESDGFREIQPNPRSAAAMALERCTALAEELADRCRTWCKEERLAPHASLEVAAGLALAIAVEGVTDPEVLRHELLLRARRCDTPEGMLGLEAACLQLFAFLQSGPITGRMEVEED